MSNGTRVTLYRSGLDYRFWCAALVRQEIGPVAAYRMTLVVDRLPKTRSGKILRATMVKIADGDSFKTPATIDDPAILDEIATALRGLGLGLGRGA